MRLLLAPTFVIASRRPAGYPYDTSQPQNVQNFLSRQRAFSLPSRRQPQGFSVAEA